VAKSIPIRPAVIAFPSGVHDKGCAAAAGMISIVAISKAPTTLIATATVMARATEQHQGSQHVP
jgi:hypothetical protein